MENIKTMMCDLPATIGGFTIVTDDFYTIVLNQNLTRERNLETYNHEMCHIQQGDFAKQTSAGMIEIMAHSI